MMRKLLIRACLGLAALLPGVLRAEDQPVKLDKGDAAPAFEAKDDSGKLWKSSDHVGKKVVVVYFFPAAMTGG